jgi:hypothetical protein
MALKQPLCRANSQSLEEKISIKQISMAKQFALRRRLWFKALNRVERGIIDLTVQCVDNIKSPKLAEVLSAIMEKLKFAAESIIERTMRTVGFPLAQKTSLFAQSWGHRSAFSWGSDARFVRYLAVMSLNSRGLS